MEPKFYITMNIRSGNGFEEYGRFFLGEDAKFADTVFNKLLGSTEEVSEKTILYIGFIEMKNDLPLNLKMISSTLDQLSENCRMITKDMFKLFNLEGV